MMDPQTARVAASNMWAARDRLLRDPPNPWTQAALDVLATGAEGLLLEWAPQWGTAMPTVQAEGIRGTWVAKCPYCEVSDHRFIMPDRGNATFGCTSEISPEPGAQPRQFYAIAPAGSAPDNAEPPSPPYLTGTRVTERPYR